MRSVWRAAGCGWYMGNDGICNTLQALLGMLMVYSHPFNARLTQV